MRNDTQRPDAGVLPLFGYYSGGEVDCSGQLFMLHIRYIANIAKERNAMNGGKPSNSISLRFLRILRILL